MRSRAPRRGLRTRHGRSAGPRSAREGVPAPRVAMGGLAVIGMTSSELRELS